MQTQQTIAAISTAVGYGGIAIVRISGKESFNICERIFARPGGKPFQQQTAGSICYGHIVSQKGEILDEVLVSKMPAPHTYTREDIAEINCHGGFAAAKLVLEAVLQSGARLAEPGEFTKRAFLNGRIDLSQAEAISDIITSKTELSAKAAVSQLSGTLSDAINEIKAKIITLLSSLEVTIQYPEYDVEDLTNEELTSMLKEIKSSVERLLSTYKKGEILKEGLKVVIAGKPNVGKSTLLNALIDKDKAIVTEIAGTTRDVVDEYINLNGVPVRFFDTAGIRRSSDLVESMGIKRSLMALEDADVVLFVADASQPLTPEDDEVIDKIKNTTAIYLLNKSDIGINAETADFFKDKDTICISAYLKENTDEILTRLLAYAQGQEQLEHAMISNIRHKTHLADALSSINTAFGAAKEGTLPIDFIEIDIRDCLDSLGKITGETASEEIIDEIFSNFCLGK